MMDARSFLDTVAGYANSPTGGPRGSADRPVRTGVVDPAYASGLARVTFDGELTMSEKGYTWSASYNPVGGDRVFLTPIGTTYMIGGKVTSSPPAVSGFVDKAYVDSITTPVDLAVGTNLNNYTTTGLWHQNSNANAASGTNYPVALAGLLEVFTRSSMVYQRYTEYNTGIIHTRTKYTTTWYAWSEVAQESAWVKLANASGWSDYVGGGGYRSGTWARRFGDNVQITGMVKGSSGVMANLPSNLRPTYSALYPAIAVGQPCGIYVMGNNGDIPGNIQYLFGPATPDYVNITLTIPMS